jgi:HEAT repeat protein
VLSGQPGDRASGLDALRAPRRARAARTRLERALSDADPAVKLTALEVLADKDPRASLAAVAGALEDSAAPVRLQAIRLLADARDPRAALALLGHTATPTAACGARPSPRWGRWGTSGWCRRSCACSTGPWTICGGRPSRR